MNSITINVQSDLRDEISSIVISLHTSLIRSLSDVKSLGALLLNTWVLRVIQNQYSRGLRSGGREGHGISNPGKLLFPWKNSVQVISSY